MYIFVLQWPPALKSALGAGVSVPFGTVFSCFMVCCMIGSTLFLAAGAAVVLLAWRENMGGKAAAAAAAAPKKEKRKAKEADAKPESAAREDGGTIVKDALAAMLADRKILLVGAVQVGAAECCRVLPSAAECH